MSAPGVDETVLTVYNEDTVFPGIEQATVPVTEEEQPGVHQDNDTIFDYQPSANPEPKESKFARFKNAVMNDDMLFYHILEALLFMVVPGAVFVLIMYIFAFHYDDMYVLAWILLVFILLLSLYLIIARLWSTRYPDRDPKPRSWLFIGMLCIVTAMLGLALGLFDHYMYMAENTYYSTGRAYANVMAGDDPMSRKDATQIAFSSDAWIDASKAVGFFKSNIYCVAPVLSLSSEENYAGHWVVGLNCCRTGIFSCADAQTIRGKHAQVISHRNPFAMNSYKTYLKAVMQASVVHGISIPKDPTLVRWTAPGEMSLESSATKFYFDSVFIVFSVSAILGFIVGVMNYSVNKGL